MIDEDEIEIRGKPRIDGEFEIGSGGNLIHARVKGIGDRPHRSDVVPNQQQVLIHVCFSQSIDDESRETAVTFFN